MAINKVIFGNTTLIDTSGVTVTPSTMITGTTALDATGETITGTLTLETLNALQNGTYNAPTGKAYNSVTVNTNKANILRGSDTPTAAIGNDGDIYLKIYDGTNGVEQITDVSLFTALYSTSIPYGSYGGKVRDRLVITDESSHTSLMNGGWTASGATFYDSENRIGAYGGYSFGTVKHLVKAKFWLGRYSGQNKTLTVTLEYLDGNGDWNEIEDLSLTTNLDYPVNIFEVQLDQSIDMYGLRWIHKKEPIKTPNNNVCFFGMTMYEYVQSGTIKSSFLKVSGSWQDLTGSSIKDVNTGGGSGGDWLVSTTSVSEITT